MLEAFVGTSASASAVSERNSSADEKLARGLAAEGGLEPDERFALGEWDLLQTRAPVLRSQVMEASSKGGNRLRTSCGGRSP